MCRFFLVFLLLSRCLVVFGNVVVVIVLFFSRVWCVELRVVCMFSGVWVVICLVRVMVWLRRFFGVVIFCIRLR